MTGAFDMGKIFGRIREELENAGVTFHCGEDVDAWEVARDAGVKVVCVAPGLKSSVEEMGKSTRDRVVMVRVDRETSEALDAWVQTGAVKSRSEAAALFIREGLRVRADELDRLKDALEDVEKARKRLHRRAREVFGSGAGDAEASD